MRATEDLAPAEPRKRVGVICRRIEPGLRRVLACLESIAPVSFEIVGAKELDALDAALILDLARMPQMPAQIPVLICPGSSGGEGIEPSTVKFADDERVQAPLHGRAIIERGNRRELPIAPPDARSVLAHVGREPVWWNASVAGQHAKHHWVSAYPVSEACPQDALRDHLKPGRFMGLLPLLLFVDHVTEHARWEPAPLRASFIVDDPNLHWPSYSYLDFHEMTVHADRHGYHVGLAMVPLDGWLADRRAAGLVRRRSSALSLLMHGNDHRSGELGRLDDVRTAEAVIAQAVRRIGGFEQRTGVPVARVMVPPHEVCSKSALKAMFGLGLDGACIGQRYPWRGSQQPAVLPLAKWHPADMVAGGLPILPRYSIAGPREELIFRALLRQPLILYGHHGDFADGLDVFAEAADYINGLGEVQWGSTGWIASQNVFTRRSGETMTVQLHSRRATVEIPADTTLLHVETPSLDREESTPYLVCEGARMAMAHDGHRWRSRELRVLAGAQLELALAPAVAIDPAVVEVRRAGPWPLVRRALVEGRDRLEPLSQKLSAR